MDSKFNPTDDDASVRTIVAYTLRRAGHDVEEAADGRAVVDRVASGSAAFDLIITDTRMPRLDGMGVIQEARATGYRGHFIIFAGALGSEEREAYKTLGVNYIVDKPAADGELMSAVRALEAAAPRT